jgi:hypothetical protein
MVRIILITFLFVAAVIGQALIFKARPAADPAELVTSDEPGELEVAVLSPR